MFRASSAHLQEVNNVNCTCMQPPGDNPVAVNKYCIIYIRISSSVVNIP